MFYFFISKISVSLRQRLEIKSSSNDNKLWANTQIQRFF